MLALVRRCRRCGDAQGSGRRLHSQRPMLALEAAAGPPCARRARGAICRSRWALHPAQSWRLAAAQHSFSQKALDAKA
ncbi:hypothetical protein NDU88_001630 [Pleurodeles waltl]|uniref:Uncharacterized protein n=1 Tax=Pleurodeles waltl TaxID=8319 RepID=A0AAV7WMC1_PLEWA|nr:hypothetical protein NDU88_001630 [Pleurodeles waltl]